MSVPEIVTRYVLAFLVPLFATIALTPWAARLARRKGILNHPAENRYHHEAVPYLGGLAVAGGLVLVAAVTTGLSGQILTILLGALAMMMLGFVDDWRNVRPSMKVAVEMGAGLALWLAGIRAGFFGIAGLDLALTMLWVVAVTNALNLIDNMDGLASGVAAVAGFSFFVVAARQGDYLVGSLALAVSGASSGFLRHNFPPAKIFLGDAGSLLLGFLLAALGLKLDVVSGSATARAAIAVFMLGVPLFDTALVVLARLREGRPIHAGGTDHSSHRLVRLGLSDRKVAFVTYGAQTVTCLLGIWLARASDAAIVSAVLSGGLVALAGLGLFLVAAPSEADIVELFEVDDSAHRTLHRAVQS